MPTILFAEGEEIVPIVLLFSEYPEIFVDKVKNVPKEYSFDMDNAGNFNYDIDDNGEIEKITVRYCYNELCDIPYMSSVQISVDENNYVSVIDEGIFSRFSRGYLLHIEDKEYVLVYIETLYDNMGNYIIFDLNSGEVVENEMLYFYLENNRITNPNKIAVEVRMDPVTGGIATLDGYWRVNESGILSEKEDMTYVYHSGTICENNKELELIAIDSTTGECIEQKFILGKGNQFELLKTDGHTWCDILLEDGRSGRVVFDEYVEIDETPKVNGERIPIQWIPR